MARYDSSSKWLIEHHGDALLRLAGITDVVSWWPLQAEIVQPRRLPDGLLEVRRASRESADLFVVELSTYPDRRVPEQLLRDAALVYLDRGVLPEVLVVVLHPKGNVRVPDHIDLSSPGGWANWRASWRVVEVWTLPAADLIATREPGLMPWAILAEWDGPPEALFRACREVVDERANSDERPVLLTVMQVLARLWYNDAGLFAILGGRQAMIESPLLEEITAEFVAEAMHKTTLNVLGDRFGTVPADLETAVRGIQGADRLDRLTRLAARAADLVAFRRDLAALVSPP
jgi:hypothetical protein